MSDIPEQARLLVASRDRFLCQRCGMKGTDWHHRRSRSVTDGHTHCPCNGVLLCRPCHRWVHGYPYLARARGLIVSRYTAEPGDVLLLSTFGSARLDCHGGFARV